MNNDWRDQLTVLKDGEHLAQVFRDRGFLTESLTHYIREGLRRNEGVVVIAKNENWPLFERKLRSEGVSIESEARRGQLVLLRVEDVLPTFFSGGTRHDDKAFRSMVHGLVKRIRDAGFQKIRAYGEIVALLWQQGRPDIAIALEESWTEMANELRFALLCGYPIDPLAPASYEGDLQKVCRVHSHLISEDQDKLEDAVGRALRSAVAEPLDDLLRALAESAGRITEGVGPGQATLLWLAENMPHTSREVLRRSTEHLRGDR